MNTAGTCVNQLPAILGRVTKLRGGEFWHGKDVLDYGGGKYEKATQYLANLGARNFVFDPYNRPPAHNALVVKLLSARPADVAICSNVLNVIPDASERREALTLIKRLTKGEVFFTLYEGDLTSEGRPTSRGWQANRPTLSYLPEIGHVFPEAHLLGKKLICARSM